MGKLPSDVRKSRLAHYRLLIAISSVLLVTATGALFLKSMGGMLRQEVRLEFVLQLVLFGITLLVTSAWLISAHVELRYLEDALGDFAPTPNETTEIATVVWLSALGILLLYLSLWGYVLLYSIVFVAFRGADICAAVIVRARVREALKAATETESVDPQITNAIDSYYLQPRHIRRFQRAFILSLIPLGFCIVQALTRTGACRLFEIAAYATLVVILVWHELDIWVSRFKCYSAIRKAKIARFGV